MSTPLLTFNAKSVPCDILEQTLVARKDTVDRIYSNLKDRVMTGSNYQSLTVAPRGSGKTHMTKVLYCRIIKDEELRPKVLIAYMIEDEAGIGSFMHLILHILDALHRYEEPGTETIPAIKDQISKMAYNQQEQAFVDSLLLILGDRKLILLIENFDEILTQMGKEDARLRDFMHNHDQISILATAQLLSSQLKKAEYPFYQFFDTRFLQRLTFDEMLKLVEALAEIEEDEEIKQNMKVALADPRQELKAKLHAIYDLTMGNHRLAVHFYTFLKTDLKADLSTVFVKQMNSLKTYYEQFVKQLSTQQQRIVQVLSMARVPITPKDISQKAFLPPNSVTKQLGELAKLGYVEGHKEGRNTLYEINEPLMRICFEINENPNGIAALFVDFLKIVYDRKFLTKQYLTFKYGSKFSPGLSKKYDREATMYMMALEEIYLGENEINDLEAAKTEAEMVKFVDQLAESEDLLQEVKKLMDNRDFIGLVDELKNKPDVVEKSSNLLFMLGSGQFVLGNITDAHKTLSKSVTIDPRQYLALYGLGVIHSIENEPKAAIEKFEQSIEINSDYVESFHRLVEEYIKIGDTKMAVSTLEKALNANPLDRKSLDKLVVLNNDSNNLSKTVLYHLNKANQLNPDDPYILNYLGIINLSQNKVKEAEELFLKSINIDNTSSSTLSNLALSYYNMERYNNALVYIKKALNIDPKVLQYKLLLILTIYRVGDHESAYELWLDLKSNMKEHEFMYSAKLIFLDVIYHYKYEYKHYLEILEEAADIAGIKVDESLAATILFQFSTLNNSKADAYFKFYQTFIDYFKNIDKLPLTTKYMDVGSRYLIDKEHKAIYDLTKEERNVFFQYVDEVKK